MKSSRRFWLVTLLGLVVGCPTTTPVRDAGITVRDVTGEPGDCGGVLDDMVAGDFSAALDGLAQQSATVEVDLCTSRALLGAGDAEEALALAAPLATAAGLNDDERAIACVLALWSTMALDRDAELVAQADRCAGGPAVDHDAVLLSADAITAATVLVSAHDATEEYGWGLEEAIWLAEEAPEADQATRKWAIDQAFGMAAKARSEDLQGLPLESQLSEALVAYGELFRAALADDFATVSAMLAGVQSKLIELGADAALQEVEEILLGAEHQLAPVIGCVLPLSGPRRRAGRAALAGLLLAQEAFDPVAEPRSLLLIRDAGDSTEAVAEAVTELDALGVVAIIGPNDVVLGSALAAEAGVRGIPVIALSYDRSVSSQSDWAFSLFADPAAEADALIAVATDYGLSRVALALPSPTPDYLQRMIDAFEDRASQVGIQVGPTVRYFVDDLQSEAQQAAERLRRESFDALLIADTGAHATTLAAYLGVHDVWSRSPTQLASSGRREIVYLGTSFWHSPEFLADGPDYLAGGVFPSWIPVEAGEEQTVAFSDDFEMTYGRRAGLIDAFAFDAMSVLRVVMFEAGVRSRQGLRSALEQSTQFSGATGTVQFGDDRVSIQRPTLFTVQRGGFQPL